MNIALRSGVAGHWLVWDS